MQARASCVLPLVLLLAAPVARAQAPPPSGRLVDVGGYRVHLNVISTNYDSPKYKALQAKLLSLSRDSRQRIAENSSHMVIIDEPEVVASAIRQVVEAVRNKSRLR